MSASQQTTNYNLPKFAGADKPAWLVDFNGAMDSIDSTIKTVADLLATLSGTVDVNTTDVAQALSDLATAQSSLETLQGIVSQNVLDIASNENAIAEKADLDSPAFINSPTAPTPPTNNDTTLLATTAFVNAEIASKSPQKSSSTGTLVNYIWSGTQAEYDAIVTKDTNTLYFIVG